MRKKHTKRMCYACGDVTIPAAQEIYRATWGNRPAIHLARRAQTATITIATASPVSPPLFPKLFPREARLRAPSRVYSPARFHAPALSRQAIKPCWQKRWHSRCQRCRHQRRGESHSIGPTPHETPPMRSAGVRRSSCASSGSIRVWRSIGPTRI